MPSLVGVLLFLLIPVVIVLVLSFIQWNFLTPPRWVGLANFSTMVRDDHVFHALLISAYYVLWNIPLQTAAALALAMLLVRKMPAMGLFRALYVLPYMSTPVAMAVVWSWMFNAQNGPDQPPAVAGRAARAGLARQHQHRAARGRHGEHLAVRRLQHAVLPGRAAGHPAVSCTSQPASTAASAFRRFTRITLPLLNSTMLFVLVTDIIGSFQIFDTVYVMTQGGPGNATDVINYQIYETAFQNFDVGSAAAMSLVLFAVILIVTVVQFRFFRSRITYEIA